MLEPTRKPHIRTGAPKKLETGKSEECRFSAKGPRAKQAVAIEVLEALGFEIALPIRDVYGESSPGDNLSGARHRDGLTQKQLSEMTGIPQRHISEMENGKRPIGKERAKILGKTFNISYRVFL